jgi:hypothetical protein
MTRSCEAFVEEVTRNFGLIRQSGNPEVIHTEAGRDGRCLMVVQVDGMRLKFLLGPDEATVQVGSLEAPPTWGEGDSGGARWYYLRTIAGFLAGSTEPGWPLPRPWSEWTLDFQMKEQARLLSAHYADILELFARGMMKNREAEYAAYSKAMSAEVLRRYRALSEDRDSTPPAE